MKKERNQCFAQSRFVVKILCGFVFILFMGHFSFAQGLTISGSVMDSETNQPLPGASIMVKGTTTGEVTDFDGKSIYPVL